MKILDIALNSIHIPFRTSFKHASAQRSQTETVLAVVHGEYIGYGEGCPRHYVTGESITSCTHFLNTYKHAIMKIYDLESLKLFIENHQGAIDKNPAAWCALETSILDLLAKSRRATLESILNIPDINGTFTYSAVLGISSSSVFRDQVSQYAKLGFRNFKIKLSGDLEQDKANMHLLHINIPFAKIRVDANNLWGSVEDAAAYLDNLKEFFWAVEEPLAVYDYLGMKKLADKLHCKIILDESFLRLSDIKNIAMDPNTWIPNIRISKMGGLLRSINIAQACREHGINFIIGAQVGETSILTRMAISLANSYRDLVIAQEGAYSTLLLEHDIASPPIVFGKHGSVNFMQADVNGLGLKIDIGNVQLNVAHD